MDSFVGECWNSYCEGLLVDHGTFLDGQNAIQDIPTGLSLKSSPRIVAWEMDEPLQNDQIVPEGTHLVNFESDLIEEEVISSIFLDNLNERCDQNFMIETDPDMMMREQVILDHDYSHLLETQPFQVADFEISDVLDDILQDDYHDYIQNNDSSDTLAQAEFVEQNPTDVIPLMETTTLQSYKLMNRENIFQEALLEMNCKKTTHEKNYATRNSLLTSFENGKSLPIDLLQPHSRERNYSMNYIRSKLMNELSECQPILDNKTNIVQQNILISAKIFLPSLDLTEREAQKVKIIEIPDENLATLQETETVSLQNENAQNMQLCVQKCRKRKRNLDAEQVKNYKRFFQHIVSNDSLPRINSFHNFSTRFYLRLESNKNVFMDRKILEENKIRHLIPRLNTPVSLLNKVKESPPNSNTIVTMQESFSKDNKSLTNFAKQILPLVGKSSEELAAVVLNDKEVSNDAFVQLDEQNVHLDQNHSEFENGSPKILKCVENYRKRPAEFSEILANIPECYAKKCCRVLSSSEDCTISNDRNENLEKDENATINKNTKTCFLKENFALNKVEKCPLIDSGIKDITTFNNQSENLTETKMPMIPKNGKSCILDINFCQNTADNFDKKESQLLDCTKVCAMPNIKNENFNTSINPTEITNATTFILDENSTRASTGNLLLNESEDKDISVVDDRFPKSSAESFVESTPHVPESIEFCSISDFKNDNFLMEKNLIVTENSETCIVDENVSQNNAENFVEYGHKFIGSTEVCSTSNAENLVEYGHENIGSTEICSKSNAENLVKYGHEFITSTKVCSKSNAEKLVEYGHEFIGSTEDCRKSNAENLLENRYEVIDSKKEILQLKKILPITENAEFGVLDEHLAETVDIRRPSLLESIQFCSVPNFVNDHKNPLKAFNVETSVHNGNFVQNTAEILVKKHSHFASNTKEHCATNDQNFVQNTAEILAPKRSQLASNTKPHYATNDQNVVQNTAENLVKKHSHFASNTKEHCTKNGQNLNHHRYENSTTAENGQTCLPQENLSDGALGNFTEESSCPLLNTEKHSIVNYNNLHFHWNENSAIANTVKSRASNENLLNFSNLMQNLRKGEKINSAAKKQPSEISDKPKYAGEVRKSPFSDELNNKNIAMEENKSVKIFSRNSSFRNCFEDIEPTVEIKSKYFKGIKKGGTGRRCLKLGLSKVQTVPSLHSNFLCGIKK